METLIITLALLAGIIGIAGSILPGLPGTPVSWAGLLILYIWVDGPAFGGESITLQGLVVWGVIVALVSVVDYVVPMYFTKITGGSRHAERGAMAGLLAGMIFTPIGMILGSFLGAFIAEWHYTRQGTAQALKAAVGSFLGFILGTGLKAIVAVLIFWRIIVFSF